MILLIVLIAGLAALALAVHRAVPSPRDVAWLTGPKFDDPAHAEHAEALEICRRYLSLHARHRFVGGVVGVLFAIVVGVRWYGTVALGIGSANPLADVLFCGLAGVIIGALSAETFRLGADRVEQRAASLTPRTIDAGRPRLLLARGLAIVAVAFGVAAGVTGHGWVALATGIVAVLPLAVTEWVRVAIVTRARPVMTDRAHLLDDRLRSFAASSVSYLEVATAALMLGWTLSKIADLAAVLTAAQIVAVVVCLIVAIVCLRRGAPRQPRHIANDLGVARGTVNKVYDALARDGLVETAGRHGTIVLDKSQSTLSSKDLDAASDALAVVTRQLSSCPPGHRSALCEVVGPSGHRSAW